MDHTASNITTLLYGTIRRIWRGEYDHVTASEAICWHNRLIAESGEFEFDLRDLYLTKARYSKLVRQYLDPSNVHRFLSRAKEVGTGQVKDGAVCGLQTQQVHQSENAHRFGNCILGFCYSGRRTAQPTLTMHSRTAYISYIGCLDLAVAYSLMQEIARRIEVSITSFRFVWLSTSLQFHTLKSLPLLLTTPQYLAHPPANELQKHTLAWHKKFDSQSINGESKYGPVRRIQAVYKRRSSNNLYPSVLISKLGLNALTGG